MDNRLFVAKDFAKDTERNSVSSSAYKPYVSLVLGDSGEYTLEVIDGFIRGCFKIELSRYYMDSGNFVVELKRVPASSVNTFFALNIPKALRTTSCVVVKIIEKSTIVSETKVSFF